MAAMSAAAARAKTGTKLRKVETPSDFGVLDQATEWVIVEL